MRECGGHWSVASGTFCTIYDDDPTGGCFRVQKTGANCFEFYFVARTEDFQELVKDLAMHIAAADPKFLKREEVPAAMLDKERDIATTRARNEGKPEKVIEKIVEGRLAKFYEEVCLLDQPFIKENTTTVDQLIKARITKTQENIVIARFARFKVGESAVAAEPEPAEGQ